LTFVYFTDRDLGKRFAEILKSGGLKVERYDEHFSQNTADEVWLEEIGKRGWVALTHTIIGSDIRRTNATLSCATASRC
jgi:PIN like domain